VRFHLRTPGKMETNRNSTLDLSGLLTIRTIGEAKKAILESLGENQALMIAISSDADIDIAGIQVILSAQIYAQGASKHLSLAAPLSGRALSTLERAGMLAAMTAENRRFWLHEGA
jgi:ABC-type transporter Mla MlaB component